MRSLPRLRSPAEKVAAGSSVSAPAAFSDISGLNAAILNAALVHGFGLVMLYGGIGVLCLAAFSFCIFGFKPAPAKA